eukprot:COSAG01_NODE_4055_length_5391_cov_35.688020_2_plen_203_part_00
MRAARYEGRKFHVRSYLLIAKDRAWVSVPHNPAGMRIYLHTCNCKLVVSNSLWNVEDRSAEVQVQINARRCPCDGPDPLGACSDVGGRRACVQFTRQRGNIKWSTWSRRDDTLAAMLDVVRALGALLLKQATVPCDGRRCFEMLGGDFMFDEDCKAWLLEMNAGPSTKQVDDMDLMRGIAETLFAGDGSARGGWMEIIHDDV